MKWVEETLWVKRNERGVIVAVRENEPEEVIEKEEQAHANLSR